MLKKIQIKGYKSIKNMELELAPINILIGANGTGKSNFISFFKLLRWMMQSPGQLQFFIGKSGGANSLLFDGTSVTPQMEAELHFETDAGRNDYFFRLFHAALDTFIFAEEKYRFSRNTFNSLADWKSLDAGHKEAKLIDIANLGDSTAQTILRLMQRCVVHQFHNTSETARIRQRWDMEDNRYLKEDAANLLTALNEEDTIFVCGNPRMYILASRLPELSTNGWILEYYLDFQWEQFYNEFVNKPPTYLFVKNDYDDLIETKHNKLWQFMMSQYTEFDSVENGKWYKKI